MKDKVTTIQKQGDLLEIRYIVRDSKPSTSSLRNDKNHERHTTIQKQVLLEIRYIVGISHQ